MSSSNSGVSLIPSYILRSFPVGDRSMMIYCLTQNRGVLHLFANNVGKKKALLRCFCKLNISYHGSGDKKKLRNIESDSSFNIINNWPYELLMSAYYINELILKLLPKEVSDKDFFDIYERSLLELDALSVLYNKKDNNDFNFNLNYHLRIFEWKLLIVCGYGFNFSKDQIGEDINPDLFYICEPGEMPNIVSDIILENVENKNIAKNRYLQNIFTGGEIIKIQNFDWKSQDILSAVKILMRNTIMYYTNGYVFESRRSLQQYFKQQLKL